MEYSVFYSLALCLVVFGVAKAFHSIWWKPKLVERHLKRQGIRGNAYKPLVGDAKEYVRMITEAWSTPMNLDHQIVQRVDPFTAVNAKKYGKISMCWFGTSPRLIVKDPEMMKEVLMNKVGSFEKPPLSPLILKLTRGLTTLKGKEWAKHKRIINPAFHLERLKGMMPAFNISCSNMIEDWKEKAANQDSVEVDVWPELQRLTGDVISRAAFGSNFEEGKKIFEHLKQLTLLTLEAMQTLYLPGFRFIPTAKNRKREKLNKEIKTMIGSLILRKENSMSNQEDNVDDLLSLLLQSKKKENQQEGDELTIEEVVEECKQFYLAGQETTASLLIWTVIVLAMHSDWQEKARQEVLQICGKNEPSFESLNHFKIVTMILYEVLRLYPPVIGQYQHTYAEVKIGEVLIPAGIDVTLPTLLIHHDPEYWGEDAEQFKPERFAAGVSKASKDQLAFFPFGWGPRTCIGQNFAMLEAKVALAMILQNFSFQLSPSYAHAPHTVMTLQPQHGAQLILHQL
ncbi:cytochrome P450 CYP72A219-like isoform X2 [Cucumis melo var. makuwa]|uniref:Cytochrome P450 CYP72A219-like isoform X2 n=1 Tax=Cucumis melo var. makuwa TaxID=1194695 RepID=A0A5A7UKX1_CUCMM|nr:cytochrome P450 CYP72A219-like isoform X2 [Cucumis melo var. makuwa]